MLIREVGEAQLTDAYGIRFQQIYPHGGEDLADWGIGRSVIEPGGSTTMHAHDENEVFVILAGTGRIEIGGDSEDVSAGQAVFIPITHPHRISNISDSQRLEFLNVYWPDSFGPIDL